MRRRRTDGTRRVLRGGEGSKRSDRRVVREVEEVRSSRARMGWSDVW